MKAVIIAAFLSIAIMDIALPATDITDIRLVNGSSPNIGRVEYQRSNMWESVCGEGFNNADAIVVCRQLGYPGVNNQIVDWTIGMGADPSSMALACNGNEDNIRDCGWSSGTCTSSGGVICYDRSYLGCFTSQLILTTACKTQYSNLTIDTCIRLCHRSNESYIYAGVEDGRNCHCGPSDLDLSKFTSSSDIECNSKCTGNRLVDRNCGGMDFTAVFNVSMYLSLNDGGVINESCDAEEESTTGETYGMTSPREGDTDAHTQIQIISASSKPPVTGHNPGTNGLSPMITSKSPVESKSISSGASESTSRRKITTEGNAGIGDNTNTQQTISSQSVRTVPTVVRTHPQGVVVAPAILLAIVTVYAIIASIQCVLQRRTIKALKRRPYHVDQPYINTAYETVDISSSTERTVSHNPNATKVYENQTIIHQTDQIGGKTSHSADHDYMTSI